MFKMNNNSIFTGYIKELLHSFNLPTIDVYDVNKPVFNGAYYIKDNNIVCCSIDGNNTISFKYVCSFNGKPIITPFNFTTQLKITDVIYDSYTHNYLGNYLRWLKNYNKLNLMSLYNCNSGESPKSFKISGTSTVRAGTTDTTYTFNFDTDDSQYVIYMMPVRFFEKYTIAIDCDLPVEMVCGYYDKFQIKEIPTIYSKTYMKFGCCHFKSPFVYDRLSKEKISLIDNEYLNQKALKLFIKVPVNCKSSLVVLEGDFKNNNNVFIDKSSMKYEGKTIINIAEEKDRTEMIWDADIKLNTPLQLLSFNDNVIHPFSDRLVEYLTGNAVTSMDDIPDNIKRIQTGIQKKFKNKSYANYYEDYGLWSKKLNYLLYQISTNKGLRIDTLGYLDKETEIALGKDIDIYKNAGDSL